MKIIVLFCLISTHGYNQVTIPKSNENNLSLSVLNYAQLDKIPRLNKLEVGVALPEKTLKAVNSFLHKEKVAGNLKLNPFIEWELDAEAVFTHVESNTSQRVEGFYYTDYKVDAKKNDWELIVTNFPMRIRFSPPKNGKWKCEVTLKVHGNVVQTSDVFEFNVIESDSKGYVSVHSNNKNLQRNGELIYPIGLNFSSPDDEVVVYHNLSSPELRPDQLNKAASPRSWQIYLNRIEDYYKSGGQFIRTIQSPWSNLIEFEEKGNYFNRLHYAWEQDKLIELSEKYDGLILFNFLMQSPFMNFGDFHFYDWDWDSYNYNEEWDKNSKYPVYCYNDRPGEKQPHEMFMIEEDLRYHEQRTRYYVARYGYSTSIYEFELLSEPFHLDQFWNETDSKEPFIYPDHPLHKKVVVALNNYHNRISNYIKVDLNHKNQLIGINATSSVWQPSGFLVVDSSLFNPNVDIIGMNPYSSYPNKFVISKSEKKGNNRYDEGENSYSKMIHDFHLKYKKPVIISEGGPAEHLLFCSDFSDIMIDNQTLQMNGFAGYHLWNGFRPTEIKLWPSLITSLQQTTLLVIPVLSQGDGNWVQGRQKSNLNRSDDASIKETQYYISSDQSKAAGYVRNLTENYYSSKREDKCNDPFYQLNSSGFAQKINFKWDDGPRRLRLTIEGLNEKENYSVVWYSLGNEISSANFKTKRNGKWNLEYPELNVTDSKNALPVVWFRVEKSH